MHKVKQTSGSQQLMSPANRKFRKGEITLKLLDTGSVPLRGATPARRV